MTMNDHNSETFPSWIHHIKEWKWDSCVVLIRHEEKELTRPDGSVRDRQLTDNGRRRAVEIGKKLKDVGRSDTTFISSPVQRCFDTASLIAKGMGEDKEVTKNYDLLTMVYNSGLDWSDTEGYSSYVNGNVPEGYDPPMVGARKMLDVFLPRLEKDGNLTICVSHDLAIALLNAMVTKRFTNGNWMGYADGILVMRSGTEVTVLRNGIEYPLFESLEKDTPIDVSF